MTKKVLKISGSDISVTEELKIFERCCLSTPPIEFRVKVYSNFIF